MEKQSTISGIFSNTSNEFKVMNKLGVTFFIMFIVGAFLPLVDLGEWSEETINLNFIANPILLIIVATIGAVVNLTGISRVAARVVSIIFIMLIIGWLLSQLYDVYDAAKEAKGRNFEFRHFTRYLEKSVQEITRFVPGFKDLNNFISFASILLTVSFFGVFGCMFSPRYKENLALKAAITGHSIIRTESESTFDNTETNTSKIASFIESSKNILSRLLSKAISLIGYVYQIIKPLVNSLLEKGTDIICKQQPNLKRGHVKMTLFVILIVLLYIIIF